MKLKRHKQFLKDWAKTRLTDGQFEKFIEYADGLKKDIPLGMCTKQTTQAPTGSGTLVLHWVGQG